MFFYGFPHLKCHVWVSEMCANVFVWLCVASKAKAKSGDSVFPSELTTAVHVHSRVKC